MTDQQDWTVQQSLLQGPVTLLSSGTLTVPTIAGLSSTLLPSLSSGKHYIVWSIEVSQGIQAHYNGDTPVMWTLLDLAVHALCAGQVSQAHPVDRRVDAQGFTPTFGAGLLFTASVPGWADGLVGVTLEYGIIG